MFKRASEVLIDTAELLRAPRRMSPSEAASKYLHNDRGAWSRELAPMMVEPLDMLACRDYRGIVFVGPARTGKTFGLVHGAIAFAVTCSTGDMMVVQMTQDAARDFSRTEIDRVMRHSPELAARQSPRARDDNVFEKAFRSGMVLKIAYPTVTQLASRTLQIVAITDYDRPEERDNVGGEGPLWDQALKRTETYMSRGKCLAESSPGEDYMIADWRPSTPHEAPPARGILSLYNSGTRARWYWPCLHCGEHFDAAPGVDLFGLPSFEDLQKMVATEDLRQLSEKYARIACRKCGGYHDQEDRVELNRRGRWVHEGEAIDTAGTITGTRRRSPTVSYWLGGAAAVFQRWDSLLYRYLNAIQTFGRIGDESQLRAVTLTDLGMPYVPRSVLKRRSGRELRKRAEFWPQGVVPAGVCYLTAAVDVQGNRFVVQVHGWGVQTESWLIDRFQITASKRPEGNRHAAIDPAAFLEDWEILSEAIIGRTYPLIENGDLRMPIQLILCDSGGKEGVSSRAYDFWRALRRDGHGRQLFLIKGTGAANAPRVQRSFPDATGRRDRQHGGRGDVPVFLINTNVVKDAVANDLARDVVGPGFVHLPEWLDPSVFDELTSEVRTDKGWVRAAGTRNEALDLAVYNRAAVILLQAENVDWSRPPRWATRPAEAVAPPTPAAPTLKAPHLNFQKRNWTTQW